MSSCSSSVRFRSRWLTNWSIERNYCANSYLDHLDEFLACCRELDEGYTLYYNGPQCGASAPDHMHWQAAPSGSTHIL